MDCCDAQLFQLHQNCRRHRLQKINGEAKCWVRGGSSQSSCDRRHGLPRKLLPEIKQTASSHVKIERKWQRQGTKPFWNPQTCVNSILYQKSREIMFVVCCWYFQKWGLLPGIFCRSISMGRSKHGDFGRVLYYLDSYMWMGRLGPQDLPGNIE